MITISARYQFMLLWLIFLKSGYWMLDAGCWMLDTGYWIRGY
jgi:hypothetical protein